MMWVTALFAGILSRYMGTRYVPLEIAEGTSAGELLTVLGTQYGTRLPDGIWDHESRSFHGSIRLSKLGGRLLSTTDELQDGDEVLVIFPLAGG